MPMKAHVFPKKNFKFWLCYWIWTRAQKSSTSTRTHVDAKYAYHYIRYKPIILELLIVCTHLRQNCSFNPGIYHPAATLHYGLLWNKKKRKFSFCQMTSDSEVPNRKWVLKSANSHKACYKTSWNLL